MSSFWDNGIHCRFGNKYDVGQVCLHLREHLVAKIDFSDEEKKRHLAERALRTLVFLMLLALTW